MTEMKDPVRLQLGGSPEVQDLLRSARSDAPSRAQLDQLAAKLAPVVSSSAPATLGTSLPWLVGAAAVVGAVAIVLFARDREASPPPALAPVVETAPAPTPAPAVIAQPPAAPDVIAEPPKPPIEIERTKPAKVTKPTATIEREPKPKPREMDLLGPAHQALAARDFTHALELATRHRELYETGQMSEEREAIAIEALHKLGKREAARTRFSEFGVTFPKSGYRARLDRLLADQKD